jgi:hypothetical protein
MTEMNLYGDRLHLKRQLQTRAPHAVSFLVFSNTHLTKRLEKSSIKSSSLKSQLAASAPHDNSAARAGAVSVAESDIGAARRDDIAVTEVAAVKGDSALAVAHNSRSCKSSAPLVHPH